MQQKKKARTPYQYEPLVTPNSWKGDELQYAVRLTQIVDDLYAKFGSLRRSVLTTEDVYPVGSIYIAVTAVNPATLFGGKWERLKDRFLLAAGDDHSIGETGGSEEMNLRLSTGGANSGSTTPVLHWSTGVNYTATGGGDAYSNMPPYLCVYVWKRVG